MFLECHSVSLLLPSSPRVCGDVSDIASRIAGLVKFSPRMRGCFRPRTAIRFAGNVLPAYAGMFLEIGVAFERSAGSPRVCGDVSLSDLAKNTDSEFSPRMRGCFLEYCACSCTISVLPAYAGMFLLELMMSS